MMKIQVKLFAIARQAADTDVIDIELPHNATVSDLRAVLTNRFPELTPMGNSLRFAVNSEYASDAAVINESDELACIPPVSGG